MSYSRWGGRGSGHWYTFWSVQNSDTQEGRDTAIFTICGVTDFNAKELREDLDGCMEIVKTKDSMGNLEELKTYCREFLDDVEEAYPA